MIYRFVNVLIEPFVFAQLLAAGVLAVLWYRQALSRRWLILITCPWAMLYLFSLPVTGHLLMGSLEWSYPPAAEWPAETQAIVVLSGGYAPPDTVRPRMEPAPSTLYRLLAAERAYRTHGPCPIILAGGNDDPERFPCTHAEKMRELLLQMGVPESDLILETDSRSTYENAVHSAEILQSRNLDRAIVVTEAYHMRRSVLCFEKQGIHVDPAPCHHRATEWNVPFVYWFLPDKSAMDSSQQAIREWVGHVWYALHGRT